jgi:hypothetical protein
VKTYSIDPATISLEEFRELTAGRDMLPGRIMLHEQMIERFVVLKEYGILDLGDLLGLLASKSKMESVAQHTGLSEKYLVLLKREAGSYLAKPFPLADFPGIPFEYVELLNSRGLKNTRDLYEKVQTREQQAALSEETGIPVYRLQELFSLCDLSRITGVGGIFARILYEAGIRSPEDYAKADVSLALEVCRQVVEKYGYAAGKLGEKDIQYGINYAKVILACDIKSEMK